MLYSLQLSGIDSGVVLWGQTIMYSAYCLAIISVVAWFANRLTRKPGERDPFSSKVFYVWIGFLSVLGVSLHLFTYNTFPWVKDDLHGNPNFVASYDISVGNHQWSLPASQLQVPCGKLVRFSVTSTDLTYGFGLFRQDNSMVAQMQVVPGHPNNLLWTFERDGIYTIRSTEYSGPGAFMKAGNQDQMIMPDSVKVSGCVQGGN